MTLLHPAHTCVNRPFAPLSSNCPTGACRLLPAGAPTDTDVFQVPPSHTPKRQAANGQASGPGPRRGQVPLPLPRWPGRPGLQERMEHVYPGRRPPEEFQAAPRDSPTRRRAVSSTGLEPGTVENSRARPTQARENVGAGKDSSGLGVRVSRLQARPPGLVITEENLRITRGTLLGATVDLNGEEIKKRGAICRCIADSLCCMVETNTTL